MDSPFKGPLMFSPKNASFIYIQAPDFITAVPTEGFVISRLNTDKLTQLSSEYHKISNISGTKSENLNVSRFVLQLPLLNLLKSGVKSTMNM